MRKSLVFYNKRRLSAAAYTRNRRNRKKEEKRREKICSRERYVRFSRIGTLDASYVHRERVRSISVPPVSVTAIESAKASSVPSVCPSFAKKKALVKPAAPCSCKIGKRLRTTRIEKEGARKVVFTLA